MSFRSLLFFPLPREKHDKVEERVPKLQNLLEPLFVILSVVVGRLKIFTSLLSARNIFISLNANLLSKYKIKRLELSVMAVKQCFKIQTYFF